MKTPSIIVTGIIFIILVIAAGVWYVMRAPMQLPAPAATSSNATSTPVAIAHPFGMVTALNTKGFIFTTGIEAKIYTVHTASTTQYFIGTSTPQSVSDIKVGTLVSISSSTLATDGSLNASVVTIIPPPPIPQTSAPAAQ